MYLELYGDGNMVRYTKLKGCRDKSNNKKMEGKTERNACAKDTTQCLNMKSFFNSHLPPGACVIHIEMSQRCCVPPFFPPPATSQDHFLFRAQVDPSTGHKGVMLKKRYSFKSGIAHGGSFACDVAVTFSSPESEGACVVCRSLSVWFCTYSGKIRSDFQL